MKYLYLFTFLIFFSSIDAQIIWTKKYDLTESSTLRPIDMLIQEDEKIVVGGYYFGPNPNQSRTVFTLSVDLMNGDSLSEDNCIAGALCSSREDILVMAQNENNEIFTAGNRNFGSADYLAQINNSDDLTTQWIREDLEMDSVHHIDQVETVSDGIIIAGSFSIIDYFLMKFDFAGERIWSKRIPVSVLGYKPKLAILPNGGIALIYTNDINSPDTFLSLFDGSGNLIYTKNIDNEVLALGVNNDNEILTVQITPDYDETHHVIKYSLSGDELILNDEYEFNYPSKILANQKNEIFIFENFENNNLEGFKIHKFSAQGNPLWNEFYGESDYKNRYEDSELYNDELIVVMGKSTNTNTLSNIEVFISAIDISNLPTSDKQIIEEDRFFIYPNPSRNEIKIKVNNYTEEQLTSYELYAIDGKLIQRNSFKPNQAINLQHLALGFYIVKILDKEERVIGAENFVKY